MEKHSSLFCQNLSYICNIVTDSERKSAGVFTSGNFKESLILVCKDRSLPKLAPHCAPPI